MCVGTLIEYLNRTSAIQGVSTLLLSYTKPFKPISYFLKIVLTAFSTSIDTNVFKAHSFRSATTWKAASQGVSANVILDSADWSNASIFCWFYRRDVLYRQFSIIFKCDFTEWLISCSCNKYMLFERIAVFVLVALNMHIETRSARHGMKENGNYRKVCLNC